MQISNLEAVINFNTRIINKLYTAMLRPCFQCAGKKISIMPPMSFSNLKQVCLGNRVTIHNNCWIMAFNGVNPEIKTKIVLGENTSIGMRCVIHAAEKVEIQDNVLFAPNIYVSDYGHAYENPACSIDSQGLRKIKPVRIGSGSWIGYGTVILPGAIIGKHCVIGANSVVNSEIPDYSVAIGSPAKVIKQYNFQEKKWGKV